MKPSIPKGTRDFSPEQVYKRNYLFDAIKSVFIKYGYQPIETPVMENLSTLTGKYGEEGDRLLFKVLNNGDYLAEADTSALDARDSRKLTASISKRGLRYDLTVPFARFVVMHLNEIPMPFKRYQIQPVWRGDRPAKGRYQEFFQCDADVVGSESLVYEAELVQIYDEVFARLGLPVTIKVNNRKVLAAIAEVAGIPDQLTSMTVAIDKLDKIGQEGVRKEMAERGIPEAAVAKIEQILEAKTLEALEVLLAGNASGEKGIAELRTLFAYLDPWASSGNSLEFDPTLARGLNYYTGCIFEVQGKAVQMGSLGGGGRYDNLTGVFGLPDVPGVGISFGAERIYDVMEEQGLFPSEASDQLKLLFAAFDEPTHQFAFRLLTGIRKAGICAEIYPDPVKLKKQLKYANDRSVPFVALIGETEMETGQITLKDMVQGTQESLTLDALIEKMKSQTR
ncbi:MAG: Histidine--tRNA ligase [Haliscomenobacter sp.]|jgi:histidyl-tRNA synthetase|nr:Histidine--tRNA ligase [Haliscomenobacter sp.]